MLNTKSLIAAAALTVAMAGAAHAQAYANVTVGGAFAPGVFGQISIGNNPPPPVMNVQPVIVGQPVYGAAPIYLHVAPEEYREWGRYCGRYQACGRPVHFVRVDNNNRWWEHHNEYLRGPSYYRQEEARRMERRYDRRDNRQDWREAEQNERNRRHEQSQYWEPRNESKRGER